MYDLAKAAKQHYHISDSVLWFKLTHFMKFFSDDQKDMYVQGYAALKLLFFCYKKIGTRLLTNKMKNEVLLNITEWASGINEYTPIIPFFSLIFFYYF